MAYDKIIVIHSRLDRCLDYVQNDGKTDLGNAVDYICDPVKAGFQTAINCTLDKSYLQMQETKRRWDKYGGILGYHMLSDALSNEMQIIVDRRKELYALRREQPSEQLDADIDSLTAQLRPLRRELRLWAIISVYF